MNNAISFFNRKGGVGKTSLCFHLAGSWAKQGKRVLVLDMDPQASLTQILAGPDQAWQFPHERTLAALFDDSQAPDPVDIVCETAVPGIFLAPAGTRLGDFNFPRPQEMGPLQDVVRLFVSEVQAAFDVVLLDCPPCLALCSWSSLLASTGVVVPVLPEDLSYQGLAHVQQAIDQALSGPNPRLRLLAYVLNMVNSRLGIHKAFESLLRSMDSDLVAETTVPVSAPLKESVMARKPINFFKPKTAPAKLMDKLSIDLDRRATIVTAPRFYYGGNRFANGPANEQFPQTIAQGA